MEPGNIDDWPGIVRGDWQSHSSFGVALIKLVTNQRLVDG